MHFSDIDNGKPFDWGNTSKDYAKYRDIYPEEFYQSIIDLGLCKKGQASHYAVHAWLHHHVGTPYLWYNMI